MPQTGGVPIALLVLAVLVLLAALNATRPMRWTPVLLPSFFSAWLTAELAPQLMVLTTLLALALVALGGLGATAGLVALPLLAVGLLLLGRIVLEAERAADLADEVLSELPDLSPREDMTRGLRRWFVPLAFRHPDVVHVKDVRFSDEHQRLRLDVFHRRDQPTGCPTLVQVHGGAWVIGKKEEQGRPLMLHLASLGWVCFAPNYRLSPKATWPDHLVDVKRAIAWVREHGESYGADPGFMVLTGGSAGGHLAALAALTPGDPRYQPGFEDADTSVSGCIPYYAVYDIEGETGTRGARQREKRVLAPLVFKRRQASDPELYRSASPIAQVRAEAPPFLVVHGRNDTLVPVEEARLFVERLRAVSDQPVLYLELPGTHHAFDVFPSIRSAHVVRAVGRFVELLRRQHSAAQR
jgi:acetyl esterase/lipase